MLPFYLKLYDEIACKSRSRIDSFYQTIASEFKSRGLNVLTAPICRLKNEFDRSVKSFENSGAHAIVTLHLAYSPSLESIDALAGTNLPIIVCDTTPTCGFGPDQDPDEQMYNHGIHGVQDMCSLLNRKDKAFRIEAGHWEKSDVLDRVTELARAAGMTSYIKNMRTGLIGEPFKGMGDFYVPAAKLKETIGIEVIPLDEDHFKSLAASVTEDEIKEEREADGRRFVIDDLNEEAYLRSLQTGLALQKWVDEEKLSAFTFNFLHVNRRSALKTVPFLQASKFMAQGIGFGGEGDTLTASLVAALARVYPDTSFSEMFCPDWEKGTIFLSHMGEFNYRLAEGKARLIEMDYDLSDTENPVLAAGRFRPGEFLVVNLQPLNAGYRLIIAPATMIGITGKDNMSERVHGWFKPRLPIENFLAEYSRQGGTHHLAISYSASIRLVQALRSDDGLGNSGYWLRWAAQSESNLSLSRWVRQKLGYNE